MNGLLDFIKTPEGQGLLSAAFGGLAGARRGQPLNSVGRAGMAGLLGYGQATERQDMLAERAKADEMRALQMEQARQQLAAGQQALTDKAAQREFVQGLSPSFLAGQSALAGGGGPTVANAAKIPAVTPLQQAMHGAAATGAVPISDYLNTFKPKEPKYMVVDGNLVRVDTETPTNAFTAPPKVARTVEEDDGSGGKRVVQLDQFGRRMGDSFAGYVAPVQVSQGDRVSFVRPSAGVTLPVNMSPAERDNSARGWGNLAVAQDSAALARERFRHEMSPVGGVPKLTEQQGTATQFATRMLDSSRVIDEVEKSGNGPWPSTVARAGYSPQLPSWLPGGQMVAGGLRAINNKFTPEDAQRYYQAQTNWVTANLRKESGAVIGKEEMDRDLAKWFPQPGDSDSVIRQKADARRIAEEAMLVQAGPGRDQALRIADQAARAAASKNPVTRAGLGSGTTDFGAPGSDPLGIRK